MHKLILISPFSLFSILASSEESPACAVLQALAARITVQARKIFKTSHFLLISISPIIQSGSSDSRCGLRAGFENFGCNQLDQNTNHYAIAQGDKQGQPCLDRSQTLKGAQNYSEK